MEKDVKTFERVNTSKGGRAIPEDQRPDCFFFVAEQCNFRYVCSHEGMGRPPSRRDSTKQHPLMRRRANNKPNSRSKQIRHQQHRHHREHLRQYKPISRPKLLLQPVQTANASSLQPLRHKRGRSSKACLNDFRCGRAAYASCERELALEHYTPPLLSFRDCNCVRDTFESITSDYCPPLECNLRVVNAGLGMISVRVLLCLVLWIFYANHPQREEVFADPHRPQVKDLNSGNGFDNDRSNDETKRYAEVV
ncbi:hypothetical protein Bca4012_006956 [Brassica carinata]